jgi:glycosyltransferase involved in cell wall biosynthesis
VRISFIGTRGVPASYSGFETCVEQVGARMAALGHEVTVHCRRGHYRERPAAYRGMRLRYLPAIRQKHLDTLSHTLASALTLERDSAVVCMGVGNAPLVRALELRGRRAVFNVDGADWQRDKWGRFASRYLETSERLAAGGRSILVADAPAVQRYYRARYGRDTELVAYGADPPADRGTAVPARFGLEPGAYLLFVGRLVPENAAHDFLEGVRRSGVPATPVVVGDAPYARDYIARLRAGAPPGTVFTGYQFGPAYQQLTAHAGVFVLAATVGGTHPVLVEQMAAGRCVLARDTESNREVLGDAGLLWTTPGELAGQLRQVCAEPALRRRLGQAAGARAAACYGWAQVTERYLALCAATLDRPE